MPPAPLFDLTGKHAIVTGGASGIGLAITRLFTARGARVTVLELDEEAANKSLAKEGFLGAARRCNVADPAAVEAAFASLDQPADIVVNNAGIAHVGNIENTAVADLDRIYEVNVKGVFNCSKAAVTSMKGRGGVILNLASIASVVGIADRFAYSMSKGAVLTMTLSTARDYLAEGIRCNCLAPARVHTPFVDNFIAQNYPGEEAAMFAKLSATQPIGRMGTPEEVAYFALYLCSDEASFLTGNLYPIDGGFITLNG